MCDRLLVGVGEAGVVGVAIEELEGVVVDPVRRCRGEAELDGVEIAEDLLIGVVDAAVAFVRNDDVEEMRRDPGLRHVAVLDQVEHGRVGGDVDPTVPDEALLTLLRPNGF